MRKYSKVISIIPLVVILSNTSICSAAVDSSKIGVQNAKFQHARNMLRLVVCAKKNVVGHVVNGRIARNVKRECVRSVMNMLLYVMSARKTFLVKTE